MHANFPKLDRYLLVTYLLATLGLLLLPFSEPEFSFLGVESDKWFHLILFGGLSMLSRWSTRSQRHSSAKALIIGLTVVLSAEVVQAVLSYRSADWSDLVAGVLGTVIGIVVMRWILASARPYRVMSFLFGTLGGLIATFSIFADAIGFGADTSFGPNQLLGGILGALIILGGAAIYLNELRSLDSNGADSI